MLFARPATISIGKRSVSGLFAAPRAFSNSTKTMATKDWDASQYVKFEDERTLPARDLLSRVHLPAPKRIIDLGCGPGNSTAVLAARYPDAHIEGIDSSPDMIQKAKATLPGVDFNIVDLRTYQPPSSVDLFFSNAVMQWLKKGERLDIIKSLMETQPSGGVFAFQVPDNLAEPCHVLMREVAKNGPWATALKDVGRDAIESPTEIYDQLKPLSSTVSIFRTAYHHSLENHSAIVEWVKGTGLRPYVDPLDPQQKQEFLDQYLKRLEAAYPSTIDGKVLLPYPRLFVIAVRK
ncbi:hypothetical protein FE257_012799 [Aspergillus nanangensis]|uniref:Methyltransferase domain-containing protein n=1 Tax=Aspergillus nanangensis TaxID=2582783 RepID=A0AAD4CG13_ASPNN|nr:hypothetical protein FE257_012799 [Aspergillus nanangensis]